MLGATVKGKEVVRVDSVAVMESLQQARITQHLALHLRGGGIVHALEVTRDGRTFAVFLDRDRGVFDIVEKR